MNQEQSIEKGNESKNFFMKYKKTIIIVCFFIVLGVFVIAFKGDTNIEREIMEDAWTYPFVDYPQLDFWLNVLAVVGGVLYGGLPKEYLDKIPAWLGRNLKFLRKIPKIGNWLHEKAVDGVIDKGSLEKPEMVKAAEKGDQFELMMLFFYLIAWGVIQNLITIIGKSIIFWQPLGTSFPSEYRTPYYGLLFVLWGVISNTCYNLGLFLLGLVITSVAVSFLKQR